MMKPLKLPAVFHDAICRPGDPGVRLDIRESDAVCLDPAAQQEFPIVDGTLILIDESRSIFDVEDFVGGTVTTMDLRGQDARPGGFARKLKRWVGGMIPDKSRSVSDFTAADALREIRKRQQRPKILVIGAGEARFTVDDATDIVYSDVALAPDTHLIADAHDIPFVDETFDAVFTVSVLEHVMDPYRVTDEIRRVLKPDGYVFAVTPFMQQVHMGRYDVTRFTHVGHRRLFRWFEEERSGIANGPGMSVAWALEYWMSSWSVSGGKRNILRTLARFLGWPFLAFDAALSRRAGSYDCASGFYFFGRLRESPLADREVLQVYRGLNR